MASHKIKQDICSLKLDSSYTSTRQFETCEVPELISRLNILLPYEGSGINSRAGGLTLTPNSTFGGTLRQPRPLHKQEI
jgi:hypothetical protein